jgi:uncharacterized membrane protein YhaH (DUF805 family)
MSDRLRGLADGRSAPKSRFNWLAGRGGRLEYWLLVTPLFVLILILGGVGMPTAAVVPAVGVTFVWIRRLHDLGRSGWFAALINVATNLLSFLLKLVIGSTPAMLVALLLWLAVLVTLGVLPPEPRDNAYGPPRRRRGGGVDLKETFG